MKAPRRYCYVLCREIGALRSVIGFCWGWTMHSSGHIEPLQPFSRGVYATDMGAVYCSCPWIETHLLDSTQHSVASIKIETWMLVSLADLLTVFSDLQAMEIPIQPGGFVRLTQI